MQLPSPPKSLPAASMSPTALILSVVPNTHPSEDSAFHPLGFRYTVELLRDVLVIIGCKPRHAYKISKRVFRSVERARE